MIKRIISGLLTLMLLVTAVPAVSAANDESVLTSIGHSDTDTVSLSGSTRNVTLTVPFNYGNTVVDLVNGLDITYNEALYKSVVAVPDSPGTAVVGDEDYVAVTVSFNNVGDADDAAKSETIYHVRVVREEKTAAVFSGVVNKEVRSGGTLTLTASDFRANYNQNDGQDIGYVTISGSNLVAGTLVYSGGDVFQTPIYTDDDGNFIGSLTFEASSSGAVSYDVSAYEKNTLEYVGSAVLTITVYTVPTVSTFTGSVYTGASKSYSELNLSSYFNLQGGTFDSLEITPADATYGSWYLGSAVLTSGSANSVDHLQVGNLSFRGTSAGTATFTWRVSNEAGFSAYGSGSITVSAPSLTLYSYSASLSIIRGNTKTVSTSEFTYYPSTVPITYIKISTVPTTADGYLCLSTALAKNTQYGYPAIGANSALTAGAIIPYNYIQYLKIVTKSTGTGNSLYFTWTATVDSIASSATWSAAAYYMISFETGGTVSYSADMNIPLQLSASDFSSEFSYRTGCSLSYVTFKLPAKTSGVLYYNYDVSSKKGTAVTATAKYYTGSSPNLSYITFVPATDYTGTVTITYSAYKSDGTYVAGKLTITVSNSNGGTFSYITDKNAAVQLDAADFAEAFLDATGASLSYVKFTLPSSSYGKLYYDYTSSSNYDSTVSSYTKYYAYSSPYLSYVSFVPRDDYTGSVTVHFTGYTSRGSSYSGKLIVFVVDSPAGIVSYASKANGIIVLEAADFADEFISVTGSVLSYVVFAQPAATVGTLYTDYSSDTAKGTKVTTSTKFYNGSSPDISDITFVPAANYIGTAEVKYTVYSAGGTSYTGKLKLTVGEASSGSISYSTDYNTPFTLRISDFISKFYANTGGCTLSCVTFTIPSTTYGKLYYNYAASSNYGSTVSADTVYYVYSAPYLSNITFVPRTGYTGSFTISYTGYASDGAGYEGKIAMTVGSYFGTVNYVTTSLEAVSFSSTDFKNALNDETGETLSYVKFALPSSSCGELYYGYTSTSNYTSEVSSSTRYYVNAMPYLSWITFVPNRSFSGSLTIYYTAYDTDGDSYDCSVVIMVSGNSGGSVEYETDKNTPITLNATDFNTAFLKETGSSLSYVKFTLPSASYGSLYYGYISSSSYSAKVSASSKYYRSSSPLISNITFVPNTDYVGIVTILYTCYSSSGTAYSGELLVTVLDMNTQPFSDMSESYSWADTAVAYLYYHGIVTGTGSGMFHPGDRMSRGDFMLMVYKAFSFEPTTTTCFSDVSSESYYYDAVATAKALGIAQGSNGKFYPASEITRQDAAVIIMRALDAAGLSLQSGSTSDLSSFSDADHVSDYASKAMASLVRAGIMVGSGGTLNPKGVMSRAEMAVVLYRVLTM